MVFLILEGLAYLLPALRLLIVDLNFFRYDGGLTAKSCQLGSKDGQGKVIHTFIQVYVMFLSKNDQTIKKKCLTYPILSSRTIVHALHSLELPGKTIMLFFENLGNIFNSSSQKANVRSLFTLISSKHTEPILGEFHQLALFL